LIPLFQTLDALSTGKESLEKLLFIEKGVKVKFSLQLNEHQAMKMYWITGGIAPYILNIGTR
jgi:hypothetical protein